MRRDLIINVIGSVGITLAFMWALRLCGTELTPAALGLYLLVRRLAETASNLVQAGTPPTLRRYVAMAGDPAPQFSYLKGAVLIVLGTSAIVLALAASGWPALSHWLFGADSVPPDLLLLTAAFTVSLVFNNLAISVLSALGRFVWLNVVTLLNTVVWLLMALQWNRDPASISLLLRGQAGATAILSLLVLVLVGQGLARRSRSEPRLPLREALRAYSGYGLPRIFSPFIDALLVATGPWLLRHDLERAGYLAMALMLLRMGQTLVTPAATVVGTAVARLHGAKDEKKIGEAVRLSAGTLVTLSALAFALLWPWLDTLVSLWLGAGPLAAGVTACGRWLLLAVIPFTVFQGLKEPIEMLSVRPLNLMATVAGLVVLVAVAVGLQGPLGLARSVTLGYVAAYFTLAAVAGGFLRPHLGTRQYYGLGRIVLTALITGGLNFLAAHLAVSLPLGSRLAVAAGSMALTLALALAVLRQWRPSGLVRDLSAAAGHPVSP